MTGHPIQRAVAVLCAAVLAATLAVSALAEDVEPAAKRKPAFRCAGKTATKVGTPGPDRIRGTRKRDVIVALGGNDRIDGRGGNDLICAGPGNDLVSGGTGIDRIYGQAGRDRLFGGPGPDFLFGQVGNDRLNGGLGVDTCHQGPGGGLKVRCERPVPPPVAAPVAPAPPAPRTLARAYSDLDQSGTWTSGDVLVSEVVDTNLDNYPSAGDHIVMGRWPINVSPSSTDFRVWGVERHAIAGVSNMNRTKLHVVNSVDDEFLWLRHDFLDSEEYLEKVQSGGYEAVFRDRIGAGDSDTIEMASLSPSRPVDAVGFASGVGSGDDYFLNVELLY